MENHLNPGRKLLWLKRQENKPHPMIFRNTRHNEIKGDLQVSFFVCFFKPGRLTSGKG
jgi:hypothetical protein